MYDLSSNILHSFTNCRLICFSQTRNNGLCLDVDFENSSFEDASLQKNSMSPSPNLSIFLISIFCFHFPNILLGICSSIVSQTFGNPHSRPQHLKEVWTILHRAAFKALENSAKKEFHFAYLHFFYFV